MKQKNKFKLGLFRGCQNFGDFINKYVLEYLNISYVESSFSECNLLVIGSVLDSIVAQRKNDNFSNNDKINILGSGFMKKRMGKEYFIKDVNIIALRGKYSKMRCENLLGCQLLDIPLGDPGLLISRIFLFNNVKKKYDVGIIPHYVDKKSDYLENISLSDKKSLIIDIQDSPEKICQQINECRMILSSTMHGLIAADSYGIPNKWIRLSDNVAGGNYKFDDYYSVYDIYGQQPVDLREKKITDEDIEKYVKSYNIAKSRVEEICNDLEKTSSILYKKLLQEKENLLQEDKKLLQEKEKELKYKNEYIRIIESSKFWKLRNLYLSIKLSIKKIFDETENVIKSNHNFPIFIISFNRKEHLKSIIESYRKLNREVEIIVHDNGSDDVEVLEYLKKLENEGIMVIYGPKINSPEEINNISKTIDVYFRTRKASNYIVTDPDIELTNVKKDLLDLYEYLLKKYPKANCVGPMLTIRDIPDDYVLRNHVFDLHIKQFWGNKPEEIIWKGKKIAIQFCPIDTTFAMYRKNFSFKRLNDGIRVYYPYEARHLDWYISDEDKNKKEHREYSQKASSNVAHWNNKDYADKFSKKKRVRSRIYYAEADKNNNIVIKSEII
ncbi:MAG: polysaccharide pyruvyl transferase family protein [Candidatus Moranbacteria bacterium]|jgi:hypothetical protein|nr:polysaccharide pyruvyl transferase family protein [Candidatus Moranbacteria bacterium]